MTTVQEVENILEVFHKKMVGRRGFLDGDNDDCDCAGDQHIKISIFTSIFQNFVLICFSMCVQLGGLFILTLFILIK